MTASRGRQIDFAGIGKTETGTGSLPERNDLGIREFEIFLIVCGGQGVRTDGLRKFRKKDGVSHIGRSEFRGRPNIEQGGNGPHSFSIKAELVSREFQEFRSGERVSGSQVGPISLVIEIQKVDGLDAGTSGDGTGTESKWIMSQKVGLTIYSYKIALRV